MFDIFNQIFGDNLANLLGGNYDSFADFLGLFLNILMGSSFAISTIALVLSGIKFVMSQGDPKAIATARKYLTVAVIAVILTLMGFTIKTIVLNIVGGGGAILNETPNF